MRFFVRFLFFAFAVSIFVFIGWFFSNLFSILRLFGFVSCLYGGDLFG